MPSRVTAAGRSLAPIIIASVALVGLALRLSAFTASLWLDEFSTLWSIESSFSEMLRRVPQVMGQSAAYYAVVWPFVHALGESEIALRLPSLIFVMTATIGVALATQRISGRVAGLWAASLFWLSYPATWASVDARPYAMALFFASVACVGLAGVATGGSLGSRVCWISGLAGLVWTHYIFAPFAAGLALGSLTAKGLRDRYPLRTAALDLATADLLTLPAFFPLLRLAQRHEQQEWLFRGSPLAVAGLLAPFALAAWFPVRGGSPQRRAVRRTLTLAIFAQLAAVFLATLAGVQLLDSRYSLVIIVAAAILAGDRVSELRGLDWAAPAVVYAMVTALTLIATRQFLGSWSGAGFQDWRGAVSAVRAHTTLLPPGPLVLYRSGNAEDDLAPPGELRWPATLAPLRGPGDIAPPWRIALLPYRWNAATRVPYFDGPLAARIDSETSFFLLCQSSSEPGANGYCSNVVSWIHNRWGDRLRSQPLGTFRFLTAVRFDRVQ